MLSILHIIVVRSSLYQADVSVWHTCVQAAMTPFVGSAGNALNRVILSAVGMCIWGITSVGIGAAQSFAQVLQQDYYKLALLP